jgi:hypothetical protein
MGSCLRAGCRKTRPPEIVSTLFGFHCLPRILDVVPVPNYEAVGGFFDGSQGRADNPSFEGGNKSGATAQDC